MLQILDSNFKVILSGLHVELLSQEKIKAYNRIKRIKRIITAIGTELFSDLIGAMLFGPAFLISQYELSWGQTKSKWDIILRPDETQIIAYPSDTFRFACTSETVDTKKYYLSSEKDFSKLDSGLQEILKNCLQLIPKEHASDAIRIWPENDDDRKVIQDLLMRNIESMKKAYMKYISECRDFIKKKTDFSKFEFGTDKLALLFERLENDILPNIFPDGTLLGKPATFVTILNASAFYRIYLLNKLQGASPDEIASDINKLNRLTAKSLESTYIQKQFNARPEGS